MRRLFETKLEQLREEVLEMGKMVEEELQMALRSLETLDKKSANQVIEFDILVNARRFAIEEKCFQLIATQQPAARDLRAIVAIMNMIIDLERMGDQAKGISKSVRTLSKHSGITRSLQLVKMGELVAAMLNQSMTAYAHNDVRLAQTTALQDDEVDRLYADFFSSIVKTMAATTNRKDIQSAYEILRAGQELERFGDLATNLAERVVYLATGELREVNIEPDNSDD